MGETIRVVGRGEDPGPPEMEYFEKGGKVPPDAPPGSPLSDLRTRLDENRRNRVEDLKVPGLEDVVVRFKPATDQLIDAIDRKRGKKQHPELGLNRDCDLLVECCVGIFQDIDGELQSIDPQDRNGEPPSFGDERFWSLIGLEDGSGVKAVRRLYTTDGDIHAVALRIMQFSGYTADQIQEHARKN